MAELWQVPDILHQWYDLISINCSRQTGFSWCNHHGNSNRQFPLVILIFPNMVKYASYIKSRDLPPSFLCDTSPNISHSLVSLETYWCQPHYILNYHSNDLSPSHTSNPLASYCLGAYWHCPILFCSMISAAVTPIPSAPYGLGTHYCFIHYRSKDLSCSHTYTISFLWPGNTL